MTQQYEPGITLLGRYVVDSLLGAGGMGEVYVVHHAELSRKRFAAKTLRAEVFGVDDIEARFRREAEVLASMEHPGIVSIVDYGMEGKTPVMVMELLPGETLRDRLNKTGPLPMRECARIVNEVASALAYTHDANPPVVHRDLKPENLILVSPDDRVKVLDFGIAKVIGLKTGITQSATALGTPNYMAPEQLRDSATVDPRADQFALASIAYECLTAQLAFPGDGIGGVVLAIFDGPRPRPSTTRSDVPEAVDAVLARAWAVDSTRRFPDVKSFAESFQRALDASLPHGEARTVSAMSPSAASANAFPPTRISAPSSGGSIGGTVVPMTPAKSSRAPLVIGGLIALVAVGAGAFVALRGNTAPPPRPTVTVPASERPAEPTLPPHENIGNDPVIAGNPTAAAANADPSGSQPNTAPTDVFESAHAALLDPVRRCGGGTLGAGRNVTVRVTWSGAMGLPQNIAFEGATLPANVRSCIGAAIAAYGRIPPQTERTVSRSLRFVVQ